MCYVLADCVSRPQLMVSDMSKTLIHCADLKCLRITVYLPEPTKTHYFVGS